MLASFVTRGNAYDRIVSRRDRDSKYHIGHELNLYSINTEIKSDKMAVLLELIYRVNAIPIKVPTGFPSETGRLVRKFRWEHKGPRITKTILGKAGGQNKVGGLILPNS